MINVGIECESIEDNQQWGMGRNVSKMLEEISQRPELAQEFQFYLYFKSKIPEAPFLNKPIFIKKIVRVPLLSGLLAHIAPASFSLYYYFLLPIKLYFEKLDIMYFPNYMLPLIFAGPKSLIDLTEDAYYEAHYGSNPFRYRLAYRIFCWWAAKRGTRIVAFSQTSRQELAKLYRIYPSKITVNHHGINLAAPKSTDQDNNIVRHYILYMGQAFPRRHLRETMLAFEQIAPEFPELQFITVGRDLYNPPVIKELVRTINQRLGREAIIHHDYVSEGERDQLFRNARAVVYISTTEAFGLPPLEALSYGTVPIVALTPTTQELLGNNAFFVEKPEILSSIVKTIKEALVNEHKRNDILKAVPGLVERYTWQAHTDRFLETLRSMYKNI